RVLFRSGFLAPGISASSDTGFSLSTPYHFNLAPNYDATLYPTYMAKRGLLMEGEFRYLTKSSEGQIGGAWLDDKEDERELQSDYQDQRWLYNWQHRQGLDGRLLAEVDYSEDRKSTRLNSSHVKISYAVFCLKKKNVT